jgi:hypothetical protein
LKRVIVDVEDVEDVEGEHNFLVVGGEYVKELLKELGGDEGPETGADFDFELVFGEVWVFAFD